MAPKKDTLLELCTTTITVGNSIAVHILDYLSVVKDPPHGFNKLAVQFLETSRVLIPAKTGLTEAARSYTQFSTDVTNELRERFRSVSTAFTVLNQVVNRFLDNERKQGFSKIGKGFRMMFADSEIDKLRQSLVQCREALSRSPQVLQWTLGENQIEPAAGIGYTALAAVLDRPDPTRGRPREESPPPQRAVRSAPPELPLLPPAQMLERYATSSSSRRGLSPGPASPVPNIPSRSFESPGLRDMPMFERERPPAPTWNSRESSKMSTSTASNMFSNRSSGMPLSDNMSDITSPTSVAELDEMMASQEFDEKPPTHAVRVMVDPSKVPRWSPKHRAGTISVASKQALLTAIQQKNHKMVEQLLDSGVPADNGPERNLLTVAIVNHDFASVRLLLLFGANANAKDKDGFTPLFSATQASFYEAAQLLLKYGADTNLSAGPYDETPFARSLSSGQTPFAQLYLKYGADADAIMGNGNTPFIQTFNKTAPISLVELMFVYNADPNCKNGRGETALFKAINAERLDLVQVLINNGANPNLPGPKHMLWPAVHQPKTLELLLEQGADLLRAPGVLELATSINSLEAVDILLKHGADPNAKKDGIFTPLCTAIRDNRGNLVDILLEAGADPNLPASEYPAFKCVTHHRPHFLPRLLAAGANPSSPKGIIETAIAHNDRDCLSILLEHKVDPNARSPAGHTPLSTAIQTDRHEMMDILLAYGADPAVRGQEWPISMAVKNPVILAKLLPHIQRSRIIKGALEMAVVSGQLESVKLLLAKGVNVEEKNGGVFSPLTTSIREDRKDIFMYLIDEAGADPNMPGEHLPIIKAIRRHREDDLSYIEHLITKGADINLMYRGWNAVLQAVDNGDTKILKLLADRGSPDLNARDESGMSVLQIMEERGLREEEQILLGGRSPSPLMKEAFSQLRDLVRE
ncbi:hypothetical protein LTR37_006906 [Vermiconidia calcicola]|uniref:Uncharacterized protein n=1 Tax=Vermiconidia calcicola TaxID=1690605 RepID=A0ACC3NES3_9PEZI|nr:hypothetical protein LTR37_006906 [Vermiconidia calcicola]